MDDLISRQAAIDALKGLEFCHYMEFGEYIGEDTREVRLIRAEKAQDALQNLPSAQLERKTGRWIEDGHYERCSECGEVVGEPYNFCPHYGAKMEVKDD